MGDMSFVSGTSDSLRPLFNLFWEWLTANAGRPLGGRVVEIGLGPNGFAPFYAERFKSYIGLDVDDYRDNYRHIPNVEPVIYDGLSMPIEDSYADLVVSHSTFEHIENVAQVMKETDRLLKTGGLFYLTINPLYFSSWGSHGTFADNVTKLPAWDHLDPSSTNFMTDCPPQMIHNGKKGCYLNKLTMSKLLAVVGEYPWSILRLDRMYEHMPVPPFLANCRDFNLTDVFNHDFRMLVKKDALLTKDGPRFG